MEVEVKMSFASRRQRAPKERYPAPGGLMVPLVSSRGRWVALICFLLLVAFTGGSSRPDVPALVVLRPIAVLLAFYALYVATPGQLREIRVPLLLIAALMFLVLSQLVPMPAAIWTSLPQREVVAEAGVLAGMVDSSRPLSLDPNRTWNTFFALFVPLAAICLVAIQGPRHRRRIVPMLVVVSLLSAGLGLLQLMSGDGLHLYHITHRGSPVGLFANKNHQAILLLWLMLAASWLAVSADWRQISSSAAIGGSLATILVLFPLLVLTGSRAGLLLAPFVLLLCGWLLFSSVAAKEVLRRAGWYAKVVLGGGIASLVVPLLFVFAMLATSGRRTAFSRLFELDASEDLRWQYSPAMLRMARDFLPFGSGFGSFESVFNMYEPANLLSSRYMNQAHNDFLQVAIEGGVLAVAVFVLGLVWYLRRCWRLWRSGRPDGQAHAGFFAGSLLLWLAASAVDYPLRTPLAAMLVVALTAHLSYLSSSICSDPGAPAQGGAS
jgi:O-antigen ligase